MKCAGPPSRKPRAGIRQVAATIFFGLFAVGRKNTWEKDGVTVTPVQVVVGALIGLLVVLAGLIALVITVTR